ncbi:trypsin-like peptidase domain-containing protein [Streptomyces sp. T-3]|nr:trypsin-like peptidase domain-containing protein [Streptomyces sp. T-3]
MNSATWHARIRCGRTTGAGFPVSETHVLTCAHVVAGSVTGDAECTVSFPLRGGLADIPAKVVTHGGWAGRATDPGDLAVLELSRPLGGDFAQFAPPSYEAAAGRIVAYGFPSNYPEQGTLAAYQTTARQLIAGEWVQLEALTDFGQPLVKGFSGAAAVLEDTGQVIGMISAVDKNPEVRTARMLPAHVLARYWPRLCELVPTPGHEREEKAELLRLIERVEASQAASPCGPPGRIPPDLATRLYRKAAGPLGTEPPERGFASLWDATWFALYEAQDTDAVRRFALLLADVTEDTPTRRALQCWPRTDRAGWPAAVPGPKPEPEPHRLVQSILVEVDHSGVDLGEFLVDVSVHDGRELHWIGHQTLPQDRIRDYALARVEEAYTFVHDRAPELIAFALPRKYLNVPVHTWPCAPDDPTPLGTSSPVVVMDLLRRRNPRLQHKLRLHWQALERAKAAGVHRIECGIAEEQGPLTVRLRRHTGALGLAEPPNVRRTLPHLEAGLNAAVPVVLWPMRGCRSDHGGGGGDCVGTEFLDELSTHLTDLDLTELPFHIWELRKLTEQPWAQNLTLLWEDPRCFPQTPRFAHSPVG